MTYERTRRLRPVLRLPTTHAWYLTYRAAKEGREVGDTIVRMLRKQIAGEVARLGTRERYLLDHSMPEWMRYQGEPWDGRDEQAA